MSMANYLEDEILDHIFGTAYSAPATRYIGLHTGDPGETGASDEVSGNNYIRATENGWTTSSGGAISNSGIVTFATPSGSWGTVSHVSIWDAASGGNCLFVGSLTASKAIGSGDSVTFPIGDLDVSID